MSYLEYYNIDSFKWVEDCYKNTAPINEKDVGTKHDKRPIGSRRRKWERIHKFSDNCYGLFDGNRGDPLGWYRTSATEAEAKKLCPILWTRHRDGTETVKIRNGSGTGMHPARYSFLERFLPYKLQFVLRNGKQFIRNQSDGKEYYLAKSRLIPTAESEHIAHQQYANAWYTRQNFTTKDDGVALTFRCEKDGSFTYLDGGKGIPQPPRVRVNKKLKDKYKAHINELWQYVCTVGPMLPVEDREYRQQMRTEIYEADGGTRHSWSSFGMTQKLALEILKDYNHPLRLNIVAQYVASSDIKSCQTEDDLKRVRAHFNRWINKHCDFVKIVK